MNRIAVASGKGGTGKTTVATSLALTLKPENTHFLDCDVEAPNAHLYLGPALDQKIFVENLVPEIDESRCTYCGRCAEVCQFHAIAVVGRKTLVFPELCHACGSCTLICPENAIQEKPHAIGYLESGDTPSGMAFSRGVMHIGEPMSVPIIRQLKKRAANEDDHYKTIIIDAPPGTSCPVVESVRETDFVLLVTEPTPFGLHDLALAVEMVRELGLPAGVIINRDGIGDAQVDAFCEENNLPVLMRIPMQREIAEALARGIPLVEAFPAYHTKFAEVYRMVREHLKTQAQGEVIKEGAV